MNMNDRFEPPDTRKQLSIPLSSVIRAVGNWFEVRRIKRDLNNVRNYEDVVTDYMQDQ